MARTLSSRLRQRVDIVRPTPTKNGKGGFVTVPVTFAVRVAAEVIGLTGSEAVREKLLAGIRVYRVTMRLRSDVVQTDQLRHGGEILNIRSAIADYEKRELVIIADTQAVAT